MHRVGLPSHFGIGNGFLWAEELSSVVSSWAASKSSTAGIVNNVPISGQPCWGTSFKTQSSVKTKVHRYGDGHKALGCWHALGDVFGSATTKLPEDTRGGSEFIWAGVFEVDLFITRFSRLFFSLETPQEKKGHHLWVLPLLAGKTALLASVCKVSYVMCGQKPP